MLFDIHLHAAEDLDRLATSNPQAAASVVVALQEIRADPRAIDKLTQHGNNVLVSKTINVKRWVTAKSKRGDIWRLRVLNTPATNYRVVYGYHYQTRQVCVLAVAEKDVELDYDAQSDLVRRIRSDWLALS